MNPVERLPDDEARRRIATDLDSSLVVVAGAGTGKTSALVERIVELVGSGAPVRDLAAITFTEAAASELRSRVRRALSGYGSPKSGDSASPAGRDDVDDAAICTLHAFAQRILAEHSVAVGLPPGFDVLDPVAEQADFERAFAVFLDDLLDDQDLEEVLVAGLALGVDDGALGAVAWVLHNNWDRLDDGAARVLEERRHAAGQPLECDVQSVLSAIDQATAMAGQCTEADDKLLAFLTGNLSAARDTLAEVAHEPLAALPRLLALPVLRSTLGQRGNWAVAVTEVRDATARAEQARQDALGQIRTRVADDLMARLSLFTMEHAAERARQGRVTFHDLLVHARRLLRDDAEARAALGERYRWLLVDEFQDTDPIQVELAARLVSAVEGSGSTGDARPGALFVVGDPKQSIYRFRRADIDMFERVCAEVGEQLVLTANFRSAPGVITFVNTVFSILLGDGGDGQAAQHVLTAVRAPMPATAHHSSSTQLRLAGMEPDEPSVMSFISPPVLVMGGPIDRPMTEVRRTAARHVAACAARAVSESWSVSDPDDPWAPPRPARWSDVAVLIPTRTSLAPLEQAFDEAGVPFRLEGAALLWGSDDVEDVLCALRAADDPSDAVSVLAALRSPGLGCGDDDLVTWARAGGSWDPRADTPAGPEDHPVGAAMEVLLRLHRRRWWSEPADMVRIALAELQSFEVSFAHRRPRDHWQRLRWLADQARLFDETAGGTLHEFLVWADLQRQEDGRASTLGPPDADDDAVRVMTVHGAKGLEFPVVVVAGLEREEGSGFRSDPVLWDGPDAVEVRVTRDLFTAGFAALDERERRLDALERVRLLYVAMTRARDHLVLALHHKADGRASHAQVLDEICRENPLLWRRLTELDEVLAVEQSSAAPEADIELAVAWNEGASRWQEERHAALSGLRALRVVTATSLAHDPGAAGQDPADDPGWVRVAGHRRSADGALDIGRAVHQALAALDLTTPDVAGIDDQSRRRAASNRVELEAPTVAAMVRCALRAESVRLAATVPHHKEMYAAMALDDSRGIFEGFVDLVVETPDGLVVVDYKTDRVEGPGGLDGLVERYRLQVGLYAWALEQVTGERVVRGVLLFVAGPEPIEYVLEGEELRRSLSDARARASSPAVA